MQQSVGQEGRIIRTTNKNHSAFYHLNYGKNTIKKGKVYLFYRISWRNKKHIYIYLFIC